MFDAKMVTLKWKLSNQVIENEGIPEMNVID